MTNYQNGKIYKIECINGEEGDIYIGSTAKQYLSQRMEKHRTSYKYWKVGKPVSHVSAYDLFDKFGVENCSIVLIEACLCDSKDELRAREGFYIRSLMCVNKKIPGRTDREWREENREHTAEVRRVYYDANREELIEKSKAYYDANREDISERSRAHYQENREDISERSRVHYQENSEQCKERSRKFRELNPDKIIAASRDYYDRNKDALNEKSRNFYVNNKEKVDARNKKYADSHKDALIQYKKEHYEKNKIKLQEKITCDCGAICRRGGMPGHKKTKSHMAYENSLKGI